MDTKNGHSIAFFGLGIVLGAIACSGAIAQPIVSDNSTGTIVTPEGSQFNISGGTTSSDGSNLFHSFAEFGVATGQVANFLASPQVDNIFSRVTGGNVSQIDGLIRVTGSHSNLFLTNPAGIVFGRNASLNVPADFVATTATGIGFGNGWFGLENETHWSQLVGDPIAFDFSRSSGGTIVNEGILSVPFGHQLGLLAGTVVNTGTLRSPGGNITIAAVPGENLVRLSTPGNLLSLEFIPAPDRQLPITHYPLPSLLTGGNIDSTDSNIITRDDGTISIAGSGFRIDPQTGDAIVSGTVDVSDRGGLSEAEAHSSTLAIVGDLVSIVNANIDASGVSGGNIFIGGHIRGNGYLPNAQYTFVDESSQIFASAIDPNLPGDGGTIVIFADNTAEIYGTAIARGGEIGGNGGFIETSGRQNLQITTVPDASAPNGVGGTWLIDPTNITIASSGGSLGSNVIGVANINAALDAGTSVTITTNSPDSEAGDITQNAPIEKTSSGNVTLRLEADRHIFLFADITSTAGQLTVETIANGAIGLGNIAIDTNDGNFTASGMGTGAIGNGIEANNTTIRVGSGTMTLTGTGLNGTNDNVGISLSGATLEATDGTISLSGTGNGTGNRNVGTLMQGSTIAATNGTIAISGTGGNGDSDNTGVAIRGSSNVAGERIEITGTGSGSGDKNRGINLEDSTLATTSDRLQLTGTGSGGVDSNFGVFVMGTTIASEGGELRVTGTATGSGMENQGVFLQSGSSITNTTGMVVVDGTASTDDGIFVGGSIASQTGTIDLMGMGDNFDIFLADSGSLSSDSGAIAVSGSTSVGMTNLQPPTAAMLSFNGSLFARSDLDFTSNNSEVVFNGEISSSNADLILNGGDNSFTFNNAANVATLTANSSGVTQFNSNLNLDRLVTDAAGSTQLNANITTSNDQIYNDLVTANSNIVLDAGGTVQFADAVTGSGVLTTNSNEFVGNSFDVGGLDVTSQTAIAISGAIASPGNVQLNANTALTAGTIAAENVTLEAGGDITVTSISTETATSGGTVDITTGQFFRATGSFTAADGETASISTQGTANGAITIRHGGNGTTPFAVGSAATNGTAASLRTGSDAIANDSFLFTHTQGNIAIVSVDPPSPLPPPSPEPEPDPDPDPVVEEPETDPDPVVVVDPIVIPNDPDPIVIPDPEPEPEIEPVSVPIVDSIDIEIPEIDIPEPIEPVSVPVVDSIDIEIPEIDIPEPIEPVSVPVVDSVDINIPEIDIPETEPKLKEPLVAVEPDRDPVVTIDNSQLPTADPISTLNPTKIPLSDRILQVETDSSSRSVLEQLWQLERSRTAEFADYLGLSTTAIERDLLLVQIQDTLRQIEVDPGRKAALIYVTVTEEALELLLVSANEPPQRYSIPEAKREHLLPVVSRLFDYITAVSFRNTNAYLNPSQQLYEWIFSPLAEDLERLEIDILLLSLDAGLRSVPMAALHDGDRFLIEQYSLSLIPSFSLANLEYSPRSPSLTCCANRVEFNPAVC